MHGKQFFQLSPDVAPVKNFNATDLSTNNIQDEIKPLDWDERHAAMTGAESTIRLGTGVKRGTEIVLATAPVDNSQGEDLGSEFGFALFSQEILKFDCELGEYVGEE